VHLPHEIDVNCSLEGYVDSRIGTIFEHGDIQLKKQWLEKLSMEMSTGLPTVFVRNFCPELDQRLLKMSHRLEDQNSQRPQHQRFKSLRNNKSPCFRQAYK
jgi:hypothetical protein